MYGHPRALTYDAHARTRHDDQPWARGSNVAQRPEHHAEGSDMRERRPADANLRALKKTTSEEVQKHDKHDKKKVKGGFETR